MEDNKFSFEGHMYAVIHAVHELQAEIKKTTLNYRNIHKINEDLDESLQNLYKSYLEVMKN